MYHDTGLLIAGLNAAFHKQVKFLPYPAAPGRLLAEAPYLSAVYALQVEDEDNEARATPLSLPQKVEYQEDFAYTATPQACGGDVYGFCHEAWRQQVPILPPIQTRTCGLPGALPRSIGMPLC